MEVPGDAQSVPWYEVPGEAQVSLNKHERGGQALVHRGGAVLQGTRAHHPKFLGSSQNSWDFLGCFGISLGSPWGDSQNIPKHPKQSQKTKSSKKICDDLGWIPKHPKTSQNFLGSIGVIPKKIGIIPKKLGSFWDGLGEIHEGPKQSHGSKKKHLYTSP